MSNTITVRLKPELARWLEEFSKAKGVPKGQIVREGLEAARDRGGQGFSHLIGCVDGPGDLSRRKGYSRR